MRRETRQGKAQPGRSARKVYGRAAELRVKRELAEIFSEFLAIADTEEAEFLLAVLVDTLDMRDARRDWLECLQTAFNQNLCDDNTRYLRVTPMEAVQCIGYLKWLAQVEAEAEGKHA